MLKCIFLCNLNFVKKGFFVCFDFQRICNTQKQSGEHGKQKLWKDGVTDYW